MAPFKSNDCLFGALNASLNAISLALLISFGPYIGGFKKARIIALRGLAQ